MVDKNLVSAYCQFYEECGGATSANLDMSSQLNQRVMVLEAKVVELERRIDEIASAKEARAISPLKRDAAFNYIKARIADEGGGAVISTTELARAVDVHQTHAANIIASLLAEGVIQCRGRRNRLFSLPA